MARGEDDRTLPSLDFQFIDPHHVLYAAEVDLRYRVLRVPLGFARENTFFPFEGESLHLVALRQGVVVGCVLFHPRGTGGRLFQMAVEPSLQGSGLGRALVRRLEQDLRLRGVLSIHLHAREPVVGFYEKLGYACEGERFEEVGIPHRRMGKQLLKAPRSP